MTQPETTPDALALITVDALITRARELGLTWGLRPATIVDGTDPTSVIALYDGDTVDVGMTSLIGAVPTGARVFVIAVPPAKNYVVGYAGNTPTSPVPTTFTITGDSDFVVPTGWRFIRTRGVGGGGGGGGVTGAATGVGTAGGGGGGGYCESVFYPGDITGIVTVTIGAGGNGAVNGAGTGVTGGITSFGSLWTASGGAGGTGSTATTADTAGGRGLGGAAIDGNVLNVQGDAGNLGRSLNGELIFIGRGGASMLGFGGPASVSVSGAGPAGQLYGGGGSGAIASTVTRAGGAGADGICIVEVYY